MSNVNQHNPSKDHLPGDLLTVHRGRLPFRPVDLTHSHFYQHRNILEGIWWYNVNTKALLYSQTAKSHEDPEFQTQLTGTPPAVCGCAGENRRMNKSDALKKGWMRGRVGFYGEDCFVFVYTEQVTALSLDVGEALLGALEMKIGKFIKYLTDPAGQILLERKRRR